MAKPKPRKVGNPNNQGVRAFRGVSAESIRAKRLARRTPAGQQDADRLVSYDAADVLAAINAMFCPFCGAGPYRSVAGHTSRAHGVSGRELRELAGLPLSTSICSEELSQGSRSRLTARPDWDEMRRRGTVAATANGAFRTAAEAKQALRSEIYAKRDARIAALYEEGVLQRQIAEQVGVNEVTVKAALVRLGITADGRTRRGKVDPSLGEWAVKARRVPVGQHEEILRLFCAGMTQQEIAGRFGISRSRVGSIVAGIVAGPLERAAHETRACVDCGREGTQGFEEAGGAWRCTGRRKCRVRQVARAARAARICPGCGEPIAVQPQGQPPKYCSDRCGQRERKRLRLEG